MKDIIVKIADLVEMTAKEAKEKGYKTNNFDGDDKGYELTYEDGYKTWYPKDVADKSYFIISSELGDKIVPHDINNFVKGITSIKVGAKTTNTTSSCLTDFECHEPSSCVDAKNYDIKIGEVFARSKDEDII